LPDGSIDITKAVHVNEQFQVSRQFWAHAVDTGVLTDARSFINPVPHVSFVQGFGGFPVSGQFLRTASPRAHRGPLSQGVRLSATGRPADVGATPRHPHHQWHALASVRVVRRVVAEIPQAGSPHDLPLSVKAEPPGLDARRHASAASATASARRGDPGSSR